MTTKNRRIATALVRIRFPHDLIVKLDGLADRMRTGSRRRIARAALVRALVQMNLDQDHAGMLVEQLSADPVKRGREKGPRRAQPRAT